MLAKLAIWYLRKKQYSVIMGVKIIGGRVRPIQRDFRIFDNELDTIFYDYDGFPLHIPSGKFERKN